MKKIGLKELRQHLSDYTDAAQRGERVGVTSNGRLIAVIGKPTEEDLHLEELYASGKLIPAENPSGPGAWETPLPPAPPGTPTLSELLAELREDER